MKWKRDVGGDHSPGCAFRFWHPVCQFRFSACQSAGAGSGRGWECRRLGSAPAVMSGFLRESLSLLSPLAPLLPQPTVQRSRGAIYLFIYLHFHTLFPGQHGRFLLLLYSWVCGLKFQLICNTFPPTTVMGNRGGMSPAQLPRFLWPSPTSL